uniref:Uncharacterized protein n=1 Tax=Romanomermis culicivorax TaxID=13658 RepID=A0A915LAL5_ROMCU
MMINDNTWASVFWEEASVEFKNWWKTQHREQYPARTEPFWGFIKPLHRIFKNGILDDKQLALHLWNILPSCARAQWIGQRRMERTRACGMLEMEHSECMTKLTQ